MRYRLQYVVAMLACTIGQLAMAQIVLTPSGPPKPRLPIPQMEAGMVHGRRYINPSIGIEFTVAGGMSFQQPQLKGTSGAIPELVTVTATGAEALPKRVTVFYSEALAYYPEAQRSTVKYMGKVIRGNEQTGYARVEENLSATLGGMPFLRTDFKKAGLYEAVLVKSCHADALVFIFASGDKSGVDALIHATDIKIDRARSGCGGNL